MKEFNQSLVIEYRILIIIQIIINENYLYIANKTF